MREGKVGFQMKGRKMFFDLRRERSEDFVRQTTPMGINCSQIRNKRVSAAHVENLAGATCLAVVTVVTPRSIFQRGNTESERVSRTGVSTPVLLYVNLHSE